VNEWQEWQAKILAETETIKAASPAIRPMYAAYGRTAGKICGQCAHLVADGHHNKTYYKCELARMSHGAGTDFRRKWEACGKFEEEDKNASV